MVAVPAPPPVIASLSRTESRFSSIDRRINSKDNRHFIDTSHSSRKRRRSDQYPAAEPPTDDPVSLIKRRKRQDSYPHPSAHQMELSSSVRVKKPGQWVDSSIDSSSKHESEKSSSVARSFSGTSVSSSSSSSVVRPSVTAAGIPRSVQYSHPSTTVPFDGGCSILSDKYELLNRIHHGTYGRVYRAKNKSDDQEVAIKVIRISDQTSTSGFPLSALREVRVLQRIAETSCEEGKFTKGEHTVRLIESVLMDGRIDQVGLVLEFCEQDLYALLQAYRSLKQSLNIGEVKCLMHQLLRGLSFLHSQHIMHRDIKSSNLLLDSSTGTLKICDFGMSRFCPQFIDEDGDNNDNHNNIRDEQDDCNELCLTPQCMTLWYRPIEMLLGLRSYGLSVDIWSAACVLYELLTTGEHLFKGDSELQLCNAILNTIGKPSKEEWPGFDKLFEKSDIASSKAVSFVGRPKKKHSHGSNHWFAKACGVSGDSSSLFALTCSIQLSESGIDLIESMFEMNPHRRLTAEECEKHDWFEEVPKCTQRALLPTHPALNRHERSTALRTLTKQREQLSQLSSLF